MDLNRNLATSYDLAGRLQYFLPLAAYRGSVMGEGLPGRPFMSATADLQLVSIQEV